MIYLAHTFLLAAESTAEAATSSGGLSAIGIDFRALVFQLVNFLLLFWILKKVAYKPILKVLEARRETIEESLRTAEQLQRDRAEWQTEQAKLLKEARAEAAKIIAASREEATEMVVAAQQKAQQQAKQLVDDAENRIEQQLDDAKRGLKKDLTHLVVEATEIILQKKLDEATDKELIEKAMSGGGR